MLISLLLNKSQEDSIAGVTPFWGKKYLMTCINFGVDKKLNLLLELCYTDAISRGSYYE